MPRRRSLWQFPTVLARQGCTRSSVSCYGKIINYPKLRDSLNKNLLSILTYSAMHFLGDIAERSADFSRALNWDEGALRERPESGEAHFAVGRVLELEGRSEDALKELRASFPELDDDASAHYWTMGFSRLWE